MDKSKKGECGGNPRVGRCGDNKGLGLGRGRRGGRGIGSGVGRGPRRKSYLERELLLTTPI